MVALQKPVIVRTPAPFRILYDLPEGTDLIILIGGRGGMKTYSISQFITYQATYKKKRCVLLRDEHSLIKESILNEILLRYDTADKYGALSEGYNKLDSGIKDRKTGEMVVFSKGFRATSSEKVANLKSISNVDFAVVEEAEDIRNEDKFNIFHDSIRKDGAITIIILNTPDIQHWILKRYFNFSRPALPEGWQDKELDGFFEITPKQLPGFVCIQTSYLDNPYLPQNIISRYKSYGDPESNLFNPFYYKTAILGWASTGRKGQILTKVKQIKLADYMALPFKEIIGQDFGNPHPAGTVGVKFDGNNCYCRQINYEPLNLIDIGKMYCRLVITDDDVIIADSAEPKSVGRLRGGWPEDELSQEDKELYPQLLNGWGVYGVMKGPGSIKTGLDLMCGMSLHAVEESVDLWIEIMSYIWAVDKIGNPTGDPIDDFNHLIDPWRYVVFSRGRYF